MKKLIYPILILLFASFLPTNSQDLIYIDTLEFRPQSNYLFFEDTLDNVWEIGIPNKIIFNSPHSGNLAILTDSVNYYPDSCNDYFIVQLNLVYYPPESLLTFYHRYDTDTLTDGGVIEISYDKGDTWVNIYDDVYSGWHLRTMHKGLPTDTIQGGIYGYSGNSGGWKYVELDWLWYRPAKSSTNYDDSTLIRFRFISDGISNSKEGWMIDDIVLKGYTYAAVPAFQSSSLTIAPTPANEYIYVYSNNINLTDYEIRIFDITGRLRMTKRLSSSQIYIGKLEEGIYFYQIDNEISVIKIGKLVIR